MGEEVTQRLPHHQSPAWVTAHESQKPGYATKAAVIQKIGGAALVG